MASTDRQTLFTTLLELADTAISGFDLVEFADRLVMGCVDLLPVSAAGIMLDDQRGSLRVFASTSEESRLLELLELQNDMGPCLDAFRTGNLIEAVDLRITGQRWPQFAADALSVGFLTAYAVPMQLRSRVIGAINLFSTESEPLDTAELQIARVLADMAAIGIINHWTMRRQEVLAEQLQNALNSRIVIEQAKGVIAERQGLSMGEAFEVLRSASRTTRRPMTDLAAEFIQRRGN